MLKLKRVKCRDSLIYELTEEDYKKYGGYKEKPIWLELGSHLFDLETIRKFNKYPSNSAGKKDVGILLKKYPELKEKL